MSMAMILFKNKLYYRPFLATVRLYMEENYLPFQNLTVLTHLCCLGNRVSPKMHTQILIPLFNESRYFNSFAQFSPRISET